MSLSCLIKLHRFLFAINTIAMVKDQSLFSYVAPGNIFAWILMPLRYCMPLRLFVWLNRMIIKVTHFPLLLGIFLYEKYILAPSMYEPTDFVDNPARGRTRALSINPVGRPSLFSPTIRIREESVAGFQQDRALEEVFRRTPDFASLRTQRMHERKRTQNAIRNWMDQNDAIPESPNHLETINSRTQQDWGRKLSLSKDGPPRRRHISEARSVASDPAELISHHELLTNDDFFDTIDRKDHAERRILKDQDADDELVTNDEDEDEDEATAPSRHSNTRSAVDEGDDYFRTPVASRFNEHFVPTSLDTSHRSPVHQQGPPVAKRSGLHSRTLSSNTILFNPPKSGRRIPDDNDSSPGPATKTRSRPITTRHTPVDSPVHRSPRRTGLHGPARPRPIMPSRDIHTATNVPRFGNALTIETGVPRRIRNRRLSSSDLLDAQSDLAAAADHDAFGGVPSSFVTQMAMATGLVTPGGQRANDKAQRERDNDRDRMSRLVLARMKTLEEGLADVAKGMKVLQRSSALPSTVHTSASEGTSSISWHGEVDDTIRPFTTVDSAPGSGHNSSGKRSKTGSSGRTGGSRPVSQRGGNKSNRNSVILRSPVSSQAGDGKGKGKAAADARKGAQESDSDHGTFGGVDEMDISKRGSSF